MSMDKRIIGKQLRTGQISEEEVKKRLKKLPDASKNAEEFSVEMERKKGK